MLAKSGVAVTESLVDGIGPCGALSNVGIGASQFMIRCRRTAIWVAVLSFGGRPRYVRHLRV